MFVEIWHLEIGVCNFGFAFKCEFGFNGPKGQGAFGFGFRRTIGGQVKKAVRSLPKSQRAVAARALFAFITEVVNDTSEERIRLGSSESEYIDL